MKPSLPLLLCLALLPGCVSSAPARTAERASQPNRPVTTAPPPQTSRPSTAPQPSGFRAPEVMRLPGLENVIGASATQLSTQFGRAQLDISEGDARKLQFAGEPCVLDVYLYPLTPGASPTATHVEARRASDGQAVDRASCVRALRRR